MRWKRSSFIASTPVVANAQTYLKLKEPEFKARKKQQKGKRKEWTCSNTHGSLTEKLHSATKQVNDTVFVNIKTFSEKNVYFIINSVLLLTMTTKNNACFFCLFVFVFFNLRHVVVGVL